MPVVRTDSETLDGYETALSDIRVMLELPIDADHDVVIFKLGQVMALYCAFSDFVNGKIEDHERKS